MDKTRTRFTPEEATTLLEIVDAKIETTAGTFPANGGKTIDKLASLFDLRAKIAGVSSRVSTVAGRPRKTRCTERLGRKRCDHDLNHAGNHITHDGREFGEGIIQPRAGWASQA